MREKQFFKYFFKIVGKFNEKLFIEYAKKWIISIIILMNNF